MWSILVVVLLYFQAGRTLGDEECDLEQACKDIGEQMERSFQKGPFSTKGCYLYYNEKDLRRYGNKIYYGTVEMMLRKLVRSTRNHRKNDPLGSTAAQ